MTPQKKYGTWVKSIWAILFLVSLTVASLSLRFVFCGNRIGAFNQRPFIGSELANQLARRGSDGFVSHHGWELLDIEDLQVMQPYVDTNNQTMLDVYQYYKYLNVPSSTATRSQTPEYYEDLYQNTNVRARVVEINTQEIPEQTTVCTLGGTWDDNTILVDRAWNAQQGILFEIGFDKNLRKWNDPLAQTERLYNNLNESKDSLLVTLIVSALLCVLSVLVLFQCAGHRAADTEIHMRRVDRWALVIPLTILVGVWILVYIWTMDQIYIYEHIVWHPERACIMLALTVWATGFLGFLALRTVIVRIKARRFWSTTLCYYVCAPIVRLLKKHTVEKQVVGQETQPLIADVAYSEAEVIQPDTSLKKEKVQGTVQELAQKTQGTVRQAVDKAKTFVWKGSRVQGVSNWIWNGLCDFGNRLRGTLSHMDVVRLGMLYGVLVVAGYLMWGMIEWPEDRLLFMSVFSVLVLLGLFFVLRQISSLQAGAQKLAEGELTHKVDTRRLHGPFRIYAEHLNNISSGMMVEIERRMKSEHLKTELLTNVSHDIKTPLTSIINYVDLMKKLDVQPEEAKEYADVLERQSYKLKKLLEDLIEASKAATGNITVELAPTDAAELLRQAEGEYNERLKEKNLTPVLHIDTENCSILADGRLLWRVFDNLLGNIVKYAMPGTRVYLELSQQAGRCLITIRNISKDELGIEAEELMERFVRGDSSRATEGSGLGLSISRSLTECMKGGFNLILDGDLFKVVLDFPLI